MFYVKIDPSKTFKALYATESTSLDSYKEYFGNSLVSVTYENVGFSGVAVTCKDYNEDLSRYEYTYIVIPFNRYVVENANGTYGVYTEEEFESIYVRNE